MLPNTPRFVYGGSEFVPEQPARIWSPIDETVGGVRIAAAGLPASYTVRRDMLLELPIRFAESQWPDLLNLVIFGQLAQSFRWYPDALLTNELTDSYLVYLHAPAVGERWGPTRLADYPKVLEVTLTLRGVGAAPWTAFF